MRQNATKTLRFFAATLAAIAFLFVFAAGTTDVKAADTVTGIKQTKATKSTITVTFTGVGASYYGGKLYSDAACTKEVAKDYETDQELYFSGLPTGTTLWLKIGYGSDYTNCYANASDAYEVVTAPADLGAVSFTGADDVAATISWAPSAGATCYVIDYAGASSPIVVRGATSFRLPVTTSSVASVYPAREGKNGTALGYSGTVRGLSLLTTKPTRDQFGVTSLLGDGTTYIRTADNVYGEGFEVEGKAVKGKGKYSGKAAYITTSATIKVKKNSMTKFRIRTYVTLSNGQVQYGQWSDYAYVCPGSGTISKGRKGEIKLTWGKRKGVGRYVIKMATSRDGKYSKVATVKGSATGTTIRTYKKKPLKSNQTYWIEIHYQAKKGKKYVDAENVGIGSTYCR